MTYLRYLLVSLVVASTCPPTAVHAQDEPCAPQVAALEAAGAEAGAVAEAYGRTLEQLAGLTGAVAAEAPELVGAQADLLTQLGKIQQVAALQGAGGQDSSSAEAAAAQATASIAADLAQLQGGLVSPDGSPRPSVTMATNLALQAKDQSQAVIAATQNVVAAAQAAAACAESVGGG